MKALDLNVDQLGKLPFPHFSYPAEVGYFSKHEGEAIVLDKSKLGILDLSRVNAGFDLNVGYANFTDTFSYEVQSTLLEWIIAERRKIISTTASLPTLFESVHGAKVVIWSGTLRKFGTFFCNHEEWRCAIEMFHGVLFIREIENDQRIRQNQSMTDLDRRKSYWGHSFENLVIKYDGKFNSAVTNCSNYFATVRHNWIGQVPLLFAGVVDCVDQKTKSYVELKTCRQEAVKFHGKCFDKGKFARWWLQSFLVDVPRIIYCERDEKGLVQRLQSCDVYSMPEHARTWSASTCLNAVEHILSYLVRNINQEKVVHIMHYKSEWQQIRFSVDEKGEFRLPDWFISEFT